MAALDKALCEELVAILSASFEGVLTAERMAVYDCDEANELSGVLVGVVTDDNPEGERLERSGAYQEIVPVDICIGKRLTDKTLAEIDELEALADEIKDLLKASDFTDSEGVEWQATGYQWKVKKDKTLIDRKAAGQYVGTFFAVLTVSFVRYE